jgi:O-antigen/teichoic acid export membrane protein
MAVTGAPGTRPPGLLSNAAALLAGRLTIAVLGWTGTVLIVRTLPVRDYGVFTLVFSVLGLFSLVTDLGIGRRALVGMLAADADQAAFTGSYILLRFSLGVLGYLAVVGFVLLAGYPDEMVRATLVAGTIMLLAAPGHAYGTVFQAHRRLRALSAAQALSGVAQLGLTAAVAAAGGSVLIFTLPAVAADLLVLAWVAPAAHRLARIRYRPDLRHWARMLVEAAPLSIGAATTALYYRLDSIMLSKLDGFDAVALYGVAYKFVDLAHFAATAVTTALLPLLVQACPDRMDEFAAVLRRGTTLLAILAGGVLACFLPVAGPLIATLYGTHYAPAAHAARVVVLGCAISYLTSIALIALIAAGRHRRYPLIAAAGLVLNVGVNLTTIPRYGYVGAAYATLLTDLLVAGLMIREARTVPGLRPLPRPPVLRLAVAVALAGGAGWWLSGAIPWLLAAALTGGLYAAAVVLLRAAGPGGLRALAHDSVIAPGPPELDG